MQLVPCLLSRTQTVHRQWEQTHSQEPYLHSPTLNERREATIIRTISYLSSFFPPFHLLTQRNKFPLSLQCKFSNSSQILGDLGESLLTFVLSEMGPVSQVFICLLQCFFIIFMKPDLLSKVPRESCSFYNFYIQVALPFLFFDSGILTICQRIG